MGLRIRKRIRFLMAKYISKILSEFYEENMRMVRERCAPAKEESQEDISNEYEYMEADIEGKEHEVKTSSIMDEILTEWLYGDDDIVEE